MSDDKDSKTEEPTGKRLEEAHGKGQFAKAEEITVVLLLIAFAVMLMLLIIPKARQMMDFGRYVFSNINFRPVNIETASSWLAEGIAQMMLFLSPFFMLSIVAVIIGGGLQSGFRLTPDVMKLSFDKLDPVSGFKRIVSMKALMQGLMDVLKIIAVALVIWTLVDDIRNDPIFQTPTPLFYLPEFIYNNSLWMFFRVIVAMGAIAAVNFAYQRWQTHEDMKMTKQEVKDERKQQEGDPLVKRAQKQAAMRFARGQMMQAVPTADVIVTNPTHFAVALKYERGKDLAPVVVAKGQDLFARRIKDVARMYDVPIVENKPLARVLYRVARVGEPIPAELYQTVADVLAYVYKTYRYYFHRLKTRRSQNN